MTTMRVVTLAANQSSSVTKNLLKLSRIVVLAACAALAMSACSLLHHSSAAGAAPAATPSPAASDDQSAANPPPPGATVNLSYGHAGDYLSSLYVSKFSGAQLVASRNLDASHTVSIIRFEGGAPTWKIQADKNLLSRLPGMNLRKKFAIKAVTYGKVPPHFIQTLPEGTPPEPLEAGRYYIFTAQRALGPSSYEAVRVDDDGTLEGYAAEPRAGTSYALCCNVSPDFAVPAPALNPNPGQ